MTDDKPRRPPTLRDVAYAAGVSIWTASNTFSNPHRVADATRQRVLEAAAALDYAGPNPTARTLALGRSHLVALLSDADASRQVVEASCALVVQGLAAACDRAGLSIVIAGRSCDLPVDGHVLYRASAGEESVRGPSITVDGPDEDPLGVAADIGQGLSALVDHLDELGHRRVAVLSSPILRRRLAALTDVLPTAMTASVLQSGDDAGWPTRQAGELSARRALAAEERPTAIVAMDDALALGALEALHRMGLTAAKDVSVTGVGDVPGAVLAGLTTVMIPYRPMGELAGELLAAQIAGRAEPATAPPLPTALVVRTSTAAAPG